MRLVRHRESLAWLLLLTQIDGSEGTAAARLTSIERDHAWMRFQNSFLPTTEKPSPP